MPILPYVFVTQEAIDAEVKRFISTLGPEVVRVNYNVGEDWTGDPAIHFRFVLRDSAARPEILRSATRSIIDAVDQQLTPLEKWGLFPYFNFRSESEQSQRNEPEWS